MRARRAALLLALLLLTGCTPLLEREYSTTEPHSSKFWESEAAGTLRAENYQDIVNDILLLIAQHTDAATVRLYDFEDDVSVADTLERAAVEIQEQTPLGAYAVSYITTSSQAQRGYYEIAVQIGYRRSAEQIQSVVNATRPEAVSSLLEAALNDGRTELAVRIGYWGQDGQSGIESAVVQVREERGLTEETPWLVNYYPAEGPVGLVEFLLDPTEEELAAFAAAHPEKPDGEEADQLDEALEEGAAETSEKESGEN
ncbi:hypothetical protein [Oscillibacter sp.]|uniref:hypothetical protein n=1 Tax=Oscillibacter sp. TaxID=1945593 RepID=UPI001B66A5E5|nr:hypothetical protein [Oscillibacter sp.]MBP3509996.1 hypothetical protein [Oscillibacter sp.]